MIFMTQILSQWNHYFPLTNMSSNKFYSLVEKYVREHNYPNLTVTDVKHKEKGIFSASRQYLRISYGDLNFDICAAPFGNDFYISWWLFESEDIFRKFLKGTMIGDYLVARAQRLTFFEADNEAVFRASIHSCILQAIDHLTQDSGHRLTELERQFQVGS